MKKIIVVAATEMEIATFRKFLSVNYKSDVAGIYHNGLYQICIHISGVGMMNTAFSLGIALAQNSYDAAIQAGIAGSYDDDIKLGTVLNIASEKYGDLGAEDHEDFIDIMSLGFITPNEFPFREGKLINENPYEIGPALAKATGLSVNTVTGTAKTVQARKARFDCQTESMEGIAFHFACLKMKVPFVQLRAISNYVTPRNRADWQINLAIENLNQHLINCFANTTTAANETNIRL